MNNKFFFNLMKLLTFCFFELTKVFFCLSPAFSSHLYACSIEGTWSTQFFRVDKIANVKIVLQAHDQLLHFKGFVDIDWAFAGTAGVILENFYSLKPIASENNMDGSCFLTVQIVLDKSLEARLDKNQIDNFNEVSYCGYNTWKAAIPMDVTGKTCWLDKESKEPDEVNPARGSELTVKFLITADHKMQIAEPKDFFCSLGNTPKDQSGFLAHKCANDKFLKLQP